MGVVGIWGAWEGGMGVHVDVWDSQSVLGWV